MNEKRNFDYKRLHPFKWYILENFPFLEDSIDVLTNYQLFCKLGEMYNKEIDAINTLGIQVEGITDWFDNLDVQDEVNKKLDEMAESGELEELIAAYINTNAILGFDSINDLKSSTNLVDGSYARILGVSDYKIRNRTFDDIIDDDNIILLSNENLVAEKIENSLISALRPFEKPQELYLGAFFDKNENPNSYIYASNNGKTFRRLSNTPWKTSIRDTDIIYYNNMFYALTTETNDDLSIADLYVSEDLQNWRKKSLYIDFNQPSNYRNYPCDWFVDGDDVYISGAYQVGTTIDSVTGNTYRDYRLYIAKINNMDFDNFEIDTPTILSSFNYNIIDPSIIKKENTYYLFAKVESNNGTYTSGTIQTFTSNDLITWERISTTISSINNFKFESPCPLKVGDLYYLYLDNYDGSNGGYMQYITSTDLINWSNPSPLQAEGYTTRHGSIRKIESMGQKIVSSFADTNKNNFMNNTRECVILPELNTSNHNKYIEICEINIFNNYTSLRLDFDLKDIENNLFDSEIVIDIYKSTTYSIDFKENYNKYYNSNKLSLVKVDDDKFKLYFNTLNISACRPCVVIKEIIANSSSIKFNENMTVLSSKESGDEYTPEPNKYLLTNNNNFRIERIDTLGEETSITATFNQKENYQGFSCIIFGRFNCILFQGQVGGGGSFTGYRAFDMTPQGKTYSLTTGDNTITVSGLNDYDEYTLLIFDSSNGKITFSK